MSGHTLRGGCHCRNIRLDIELPRPPESYHPRACDCGYCRKHGAAYVSDPAGRLRIEVGDAAALGRYRQGAGLADFLFCKDCGVLVGVAYAEGDRLYATINALAVDGAPGFRPPTPVSPQTLGADEKLARWRAVWFAEVTLAENGRPG